MVLNTAAHSSSQYPLGDEVNGGPVPYHDPCIYFEAAYLNMTWFQRFCCTKISERRASEHICIAEHAMAHLVNVIANAAAPPVRLTKVSSIAPCSLYSVTRKCL